MIHVIENFLIRKVLRHNDYCTTLGAENKFGANTCARPRLIYFKKRYFFSFIRLGPK